MNVEARVRSLVEHDTRTVRIDTGPDLGRSSARLGVVHPPRRGYVWVLTAAACVLVLACGLLLAGRSGEDGSRLDTARGGPPTAPAGSHHATGIDQVIAGTDQVFAIPVSAPPGATYAALRYHAEDGTAFSAQHGTAMVSVCSGRSCPGYPVEEIRRVTVAGESFRIVVGSASKTTTEIPALPAPVRAFWETVEFQQDRPVWFTDAYTYNEGDLGHPPGD